GKVTGLRKVRQAGLIRAQGGMLGGVPEGGAFNIYGASGVARNTTLLQSSSTKALIQRSADPIDSSGAGTAPPTALPVSMSPGVSLKNRMRIIRWREVPL